jgi:hypothetical protein
MAQGHKHICSSAAHAGIVFADAIKKLDSEHEKKHEEKL